MKDLKSIKKTSSTGESKSLEQVLTVPSTFLSNNLLITFLTSEKSIFSNVFIAIEQQQVNLDLQQEKNPKSQKGAFIPHEPKH